MSRMRVRDMAHPGIRQFILRTAVLKYLGKCLQLHWDDWQNQRMHLRARQDYESSDHLNSASEDHLSDLLLAIEEMRGKVSTTHKLLQREYNELFTYMMDKRDLWDIPEYFKAKTALGTANYHLRRYIIADE